MVEEGVAKLHAAYFYRWPFITTLCEAVHCGNRTFRSSLKVGRSSPEP